MLLSTKVVVFFLPHGIHEQQLREYKQLCLDQDNLCTLKRKYIKLSNYRSALRDSGAGDLQSADLILSGDKAVDSARARSAKKRHRRWWLDQSHENKNSSVIRNCTKSWSLSNTLSHIGTYRVVTVVLLRAVIKSSCQNWECDLLTKLVCCSGLCSANRNSHNILLDKWMGEASSEEWKALGKHCRTQKHLSTRTFE